MSKPLLHPSADVDPPAPLIDAEGLIPAFPARQLDAQGRLIPLSPAERAARRDAAIRALKALRAEPDQDPPGTDEAMMRAIDEHRPPGRKLFEGMY